MDRAADLDLSGSWRAAPAGEPSLGLGYVDTELDDDGWETLRVPGHWRASPAFADHDGPVLYRTRFDLPREPEHHDRRAFLELDGVVAASDVWLDGNYLGDTSGYVVPHAFEVTDLLSARREHLLAMEVSCSPVGPGATRDLTGAFGRSALLADGHNPGGVWRPVRVRHTGPVRLRSARLRCTDADADRAALSLRAVLDARDARPVTLRTSVSRAPTADRAVGGAATPLLETEHDHPLAAGENRVEWTVAVPDPDLWWPRALGDQALYDVTVEVLTDDTVSDQRMWCTGLRQVRMRDLQLTVNGERLFLKGAALGPTRQLLAEATAEELAADVDLALETGLDMVRLHGHVSRPELYEAADRAGLLVWQDLPVQWSLQRHAKAPAGRVARATVDLVAHHPSVAVWCAHHEPFPGDPPSWRSGGPGSLRRRRRREVLAQVLPSWNRTVLDRSLAGVLSASDASRPVINHSGVWPHLPQLSGTSSHLWAGWRWGSIGSLARLLRWWPRLGRFVAEFGAQAPGADGWLGALSDPAPGRGETLPSTDDDWADLAERTALEAPAARRAVPPDEASAPRWAEALRAHQAELVRSHVETLRRLKYRPTGGFAAFALTEPAEGVTAALTDHARRPKPALAALREACAPVIAVIDRPPERLVAAHPPPPLSVHVVNDRHRPVEHLRAVVTVRWTGADDEVANSRVGWAGGVDADSVTRVGTVELDPPVDATDMELRLELRDGDAVLYERTHARPVGPVRPV